MLTNNTLAHHVAPPQDQNWPGPRNDHTTGNFGGGYLYLTAYRSVGSFTSQLVSKVISGPRNVDPGKTYCFSLWTSLSTNDLGLTISLVRYGQNWADNNRTVQINSKVNVAQPDWTRTYINVDQNTLQGAQEVQIILEGRISANSKGLIAIDDIVFMDGQCQMTDGMLCENGVQLTRDQICNFVQDCPSGMDEANCGNCDFESGSACGWMNMSTYSQDWQLTNAKESHNYYAPSFDGNASSSGHYLMIGPPKFTAYTNAETALNYKTPAMYLKNAFKSCVMQFDYYIRSPNGYFLTVRMGTDKVNWAPIYSILSSQYQTLGGWRKATAHIGERTSPFMMDFYGHLDVARTGVIAIDNIKFTNCSAPKPLGPNQQCASNQFMCKKNRYCISNDDVCDYINDCADGSDEMVFTCLSWTRCNFENSLYTCKIKTDDMENHGPTGANVEWNVRSNRNRDTYDPQIDNTRYALQYNSNILIN